MKRVSLAALVVVLAATGAMAASLTMIPPVGSDTTTSGRGIVLGPGSMGPIVVGQSGTGTGLIWDATNGSRWVVTPDGAGSTVLTGVAYRTTPDGPQLVAHGLTTSGHNLYSSMDNGLTWGPKNRLTNTYGNPYQVATANTLAVSPILDPDGTNKVYFGFPWNQSSGSSKMIAIATGSGGTAPNYLASLSVVSASTTSDTSTVRGVASTGLGVGRRGANAYYVTAAGAKGMINTLNGTAGDAFAISWDATKIFGFGSVPDGRTGNYPWMNTGFVPGVSGGTAVELPTLPGASGYATNGVVYCASADGRYAGGMNYPGVEKAVLYNTVDMTVMDLTQFFSDAGVLGNFIRLTRAYSVYDAGDGMVWVTGEGVYDDGGTLRTRAFVGLVPEPATLGLMLLALPMLRRRR